MAVKEAHKFERPAKVRAVKVKHPKGFGTDKEKKVKKTWYETRCHGKLHKGTFEGMTRISKRCV
jgi:hypothetical protein